MANLTAQEIEGLGYVLDLAYEDQDFYIGMADFTADYGDEWPEAAQQKSAHFRGVAEAVRKLGLFHGEAERWEGLAEKAEATLIPEEAAE